MITSMEARVEAVFRTDRFALLWCVVAMLLAAVTPIVTGLLFAFLIPVLFFFAAIRSYTITSGLPTTRKEVLWTFESEAR